MGVPSNGETATPPAARTICNEPGAQQIVVLAWNLTFRLPASTTLRSAARPAIPLPRGNAGSPSDGVPSKLCATLACRGDCAWTESFFSTSSLDAECTHATAAKQQAALRLRSSAR
jgi:hypothetical protein